MDQRFETFTLLIAGISRSIRRIKTREMEDFGLKSPHVSCLYRLYCHEGLTARELCLLCDEDKANMSRTIRHLEQEGYLVCASPNGKRYQSPLLLTDRGREVGRHITERIERVLDSVSLGVSEEDRARLYHSLAQIHDNLNMLCESYDTGETDA